ncbi:MAG: hypothetical protein SNG10_03025 [Rikenellaceae bacterium]
MDFEQHIYGMTEEGDAVIVYILRAKNGAEVRLTNYGASIIAVNIPDGDRKFANVVRAKDDLSEMLRDRAYLGRSIDSAVGLRSSGLHNTMWESRFETNRVVMSQEIEGATNMTIEAIFDFDDDMSLEVTYLAKCDAATEIDIAPNLYFNLSGVEGSSVEDEELKINSGEFNTLGAFFLKGGVEQEFEKEGYQKGILTPVLELRDPQSRRRVEILSSKNGVNVYRGDRLESVAITPCLLSEVSLDAGELYCEKMVYKFSTF